jgi:tetratricopeptide (TPR) repeat protein
MRGRVLGLGLALILSGTWVWAQGGEMRFEQFSPREEGMWRERLRRQPRDARSHYYLGRFYEFQKREREAAEAYLEATVCNPGWAEAFYHLGRMYRNLGRFQEARQALQRAVLLKSDYALAYHFLGLTCINLGLLDDAARAFLQAYTYNPGWYENYYDRTTLGIHVELGDKATVLALVKRVYPQDQRLAFLLYQRWARGNAGMQEFYREVAGPDKKAESGYQETSLPGYQEAEEAGYQKPPEAGFLRGLEGHHR